MTEPTSLYVPADATGMVALNREWLAARVVLAVGFAIAIAFAVWWSTSHRAGAGGDAYAPAPDVAASQDQMDQAIASGQTSKEGFMMCRLTIGTAQAFGVVPNAIKYTSGPAKTDVRGRYVCTGDDAQAAHYAMTVDLVCANLQTPQCVNLVSVQKSDGTVLFRRADNDMAPADAAAVPAAPSSDSGTTDGAAPPADGGTPDTSGAAPPPTDGAASQPQ
jgi:hypothetical protein